MPLISGLLLFLLLAAGVGVDPVMACDTTPRAWRTMSESKVILRSDDDVTQQLTVKIAMTPLQRAAGFQHICSKLVQEWGVLFVFPTSRDGTFHMQNVLESLDIAFVADDGQILELMRMHQEVDSDGGSSYRAAKPYRYALEVVAGRFSALGLDEGGWWVVLDPAWK